MNLQPVVQPRSSANGFGRRRVERDTGSRSDNKSQAGKPNSNRVSTSGENGRFKLFMPVSCSSC